jgi:hypothetical protein
MATSSKKLPEAFSPWRRDLSFILFPFEQISG